MRNRKVRALRPRESGHVRRVPPEILLVIPCFRERERLPRFLPRLVETLTRSRLPVAVQVVDDGSGEDQQAWLRLWVGDLSRRFPLLLPPLCNPVNHGKGGAVYSGWNQAPESTQWLAFVDADGAVSPEEVVRVLRTLDTETSKGVWAVRTGENGTQVKRVWKRKLSGIVFRKLVQKLFRFPVPDTQCGFKMLDAATYRDISPQLTETHYCFDIELTHRVLQTGVHITSVPISWEESPGSRLGPGSVFAMLTSVLSLRRRLRD
jgi:dolichyl-phosphate beta-glucosyltransferase